MEAKPSNPQAHRRHVTWKEIFERLDKVDRQGMVYGIPKNGMLLTAFLRKAIPTADITKADWILDDIVDSGRTKAKAIAQCPGTPFVSLYEAKDQDSWLVFPWENEQDDGQDLVARQIQYIGEDSIRDGLLDTPARVVRSWDELYAGYRQSPDDILSRRFSSPDYDEMIVLRDIEFFSTCEHHLLPFYGKAHVGYLPKDGQVVGLSKIARLVHCFARRMQIQEQMTVQIANAMQRALHPLGVGVVIEAVHLCMIARGIKQHHAVMSTSAMLGYMRDKPESRAEFLDRIRTGS